MQETTAQSPKESAERALDDLALEAVAVVRRSRPRTSDERKRRVVLCQSEGLRSQRRLRRFSFATSTSTSTSTSKETQLANRARSSIGVVNRLGVDGVVQVVPREKSAPEAEETIGLSGHLR